MLTMIPMIFVTSVNDFDLDLLPPTARQPGTEAFKKAVRDVIMQRYQPFAEALDVQVDDQHITVTVTTKSDLGDPVEYGIDLLKAGDLRGGADVLEALTTVSPNDPAILYNLGMAKSDLGETSNAIKYLARFLTIDPGNAGALTALGLAYFRAGDMSNATEIMTKAVDADPTNGYAVRNLGGILANQGKKAEATPYLIKAVELLPDDVRALYGAAQALQERGEEDDVTQADNYLKRIIELDPRSDIAEEARRQRSKMAQTSMREAVGGGLRPDAMMYILGALEKFQGMTPQQVQAVAFEVAMLGQRGLDTNSPDQKYTLNSLPGSYSGLHLVSIMYAAFQAIDPSMDIGFDLSKEYAAARSMLPRQGEE